MADRTDFKIEMIGNLVADSPYTKFTQSSSGITKRGLAEGDGDDQIRRVLLQTGTIVASGTAGLDFTTATDQYGRALTAADIVALHVENTGETAGTLQLEEGAAQPLQSFLDATPGGTDTPFIGPLKPGMGFLIYGFTDGDIPVVGGASDRLLLREAGGAATVTYRVHAWVRQ